MGLQSRFLAHVDSHAMKRVLRFLARVAAGQSAVVTVDALGERTFEGSLAYLAPEIDPHTRTARARLQLANADGALRANMYGRALIQVPRTEPAVVVPSAAVQRARGAELVFVRVADDLYEARRVQVTEQPAQPDRVEVRGRVAAGDGGHARQAARL